MGVHPRTFATDFELAIAKRLGLAGGSCDIRPRKIVNPDDPYGDYGTIDVCSYSRGDRRVTFYAWTWSPLSTPFKDRYVGYDVTTPDKMRVWANRRLKADIIDLSVSDAVLYAGRFKKNMRYGAQQALCTMLYDQRTTEAAPSIGNRTWPTLPATSTACEQAATTTDDTYIITHSLGSMMVLDALRSDISLATAVGTRLKLFAMFANQWPLLELSLLERSAHDRHSAEESPNGSALGALVKNSEGRLPIVAFSDPNDLLSFRIPDNWQTMVPPEIIPKTSFVNVVTTTAHSAILGVVVNPGKAHTAYWNDSRVLNTVSRGYACKP
jgi:hypothetical protein